MGRLPARVRSRLTHFLEYVDRPLEWPLVDRALLLVALPMLAYALAAASLAWDFGRAPNPPASLRALVSAVFEWWLGVVAGYAALIAWGVALRHRSRDGRLFVNVTLIYFSVHAAILGAFLGPLSGPIWLSLIGFAVLSLLLFEHRDVFVALGVFLSVLGVMEWRGGVGYVFRLPSEGEVGGVAWYWWQARMAVFTAVNSLLIVVLTSYIISRWRAREERIRQLSNHDDLTGLANRRHLGRVLLTEYERARRYGRHLSCAIVDLDHFKTVNDTHGHQVGDCLLEATARLVAQLARRSDVIARYGGDEFMLVLPETPAEGAREFAERCRKAIEASIIECGALIVRTTASVGIGTIDHPEVHCVDDLIRITDKALYAAKEQGRNRVLIWS